MAFLLCSPSCEVGFMLIMLLHLADVKESEQ